MTVRSALRLAIILQWFAVIIGVPASFALESSLPDLLQDYLAWDLERETTTLELIALSIGLLAVVVALVSSVGLFFFKAWAKVPFLISIVVSGMAAAFLGPTVEHGLAGVFGSIESLCAGFTAALLLFTDVIKDDANDA